MQLENIKFLLGSRQAFKFKNKVNTEVQGGEDMMGSRREAQTWEL